MASLDPQQVFEKLIKAGNVSVVVGRRGSGKTAFGFKVVETAHKAGKQVFAIGYPPEAKKLLPGYIEMVDDIKNVPNGAFAVIDEAVLQYSSRRWHSTKNFELTNLIDVARHKDLSLIFMSINTAMLDPNVLRAIDTLLVKEPSLLQEYMERPFLKKFLTASIREYTNLEPDQRIAHCYVFDDRLGEGFISTELPEFWSDDLSKSWKDYSGESEKQTGIKVIASASLPVGESPICFNCESFAFTETEAWCIMGRDVGVSECDMFSKKKEPKIWKWKEEGKRPWKKNPPNGLQQCEGCTEFLSDSANGIVCGNFGNVKFIDGSCNTRKVKKNPGEMHADIKQLENYFFGQRENPQSPDMIATKKKAEQALAYYKLIKSRGLFDTKFVDWAKRGGYTLLRQEQNGTDEWQVKGSSGLFHKQQVHQKYVPAVAYTKYAFSCICRGWTNAPSEIKESESRCKHTNGLKDMIIKFAEDNFTSTELVEAYRTSAPIQTPVRHITPTETAEPIISEDSELWSEPGDIILGVEGNGKPRYVLKDSNYIQREPFEELIVTNFLVIPGGKLFPVTESSKCLFHVLKNFKIMSDVETPTAKTTVPISDNDILLIPNQALRVNESIWTIQSKPPMSPGQRPENPFFNLGNYTLMPIDTPPVSFGIPLNFTFPIISWPTYSWGRKVEFSPVVLSQIHSDEYTVKYKTPDGVKPTKIKVGFYVPEVLFAEKDNVKVYWAVMKQIGVIISEGKIKPIRTIQEFYQSIGV